MTSLEVRVHHRVHPGLTLDLDFQVGCERAILFGPSGTGKSTTLRLISGLSRPDSGRIVLGPEVIFDSKSRINLPLQRRRIGMVFQEDFLFPHLSVAANIGFGLRSWTTKEAKGRLLEMAKLCGVASLLNRDPLSLSGGERQRVGLARALAPRPRLLLCDEPVSALDLENRQELIERLKQVQEAEAIPVLYVTHSHSEAIALGDRLLRLTSGKIVEQGKPLEVLARSAGSSELPWERIRNSFRAKVEQAADPFGETTLRLIDGPLLVVSKIDAEPDEVVEVLVFADEILIAREKPVGLSARNCVPAEIINIFPHGSEAEVVLQTQELTWIAGLTRGAVESLALTSGLSVWMVIKARSCQLRQIEGKSTHGIA